MKDLQKQIKKQNLTQILNTTIIFNLNKLVINFYVPKILKKKEKSKFIP